MYYRVCGRVLLLAGVVAVALLAWPRTPVSGQAPEPLRMPNGDGEVKYTGVASCSSMACHHFNGPSGAARSEFSTWAGDDKHSKAFAVLHNERSQRITRNLRGSAGPHATEDALCLKCHATAEGQVPEVRGRSILSDGVGCEACHGPAKDYLTAHYRNGFKELSPEDKETHYGLKNTKNLVKRAELCISCHVGDGSREVNHDLIAAGHPRLSFELSAYHAFYHKHWSINDELNRYPDFYARAWLLGELMSAKASLDLLVTRAKAADLPADKGGKPWPEFSEYACFACHKDLEVNSPRQRAGYGDRAPGSLLYGTWYMSALPPIAEQVGGKPKEFNDALAALRKSMEKTSPSAKDVVEQAVKASALLKDMMREVESGKPLDAAQMRGYLASYTAEGLRKTGRQVIIEDATDKSPAKTRDAFRIDEMDWDEATKAYLAMAAMSQALSQEGAKQPPLIRDDLLAVKNRLLGGFTKGFDSPKEYDPTERWKTGGSPLYQHLKSIQSLLGN